MSGEQPELDLGVDHKPFVVWHGEGEHATSRAKEPEVGTVVWRRVHTLERCHVCIEEQAAHLDGLDGSPHVAWPASYVRVVTGGNERIALCFSHAAPRRQAEGLGPQRAKKP